MKLHCERGVRNQARACGLLQLCPRAALNLLRFDTCARSCLPSTLCASPDSGLPCQAGQPHLSDECDQMQALASVSGILQRSQPRADLQPGRDTRPSRRAPGSSELEASNTTGCPGSPGRPCGARGARAPRAPRAPAAAARRPRRAGGARSRAPGRRCWAAPAAARPPPPAASPAPRQHGADLSGSG